MCRVIRYVRLVFVQDGLARMDDGDHLPDLPHDACNIKKVCYLVKLNYTSMLMDRRGKSKPKPSLLTLRSPLEVLMISGLNVSFHSIYIFCTC